MRDIFEVLKRPEYDFIKQQERLGKQVDFLCFGGSIAYGLDGPNSDIDIRGVCSPLKRDILGGQIFTHPKDLLNSDAIVNNGCFEQYLDTETDTCIYNINKYIKLIYNCNPNTIEMLGCLPDHYAYVSETGKLLMDNVDLFITKKAFYTFAGYARQQFIRLQNSLVRKSNRLDQLLQTVSVIRRSYEHLEEAFPSFKRDMLQFYVVDSRDNRINMKTTNMFFDSVDIDKEKLARELDKEDFEKSKLKVNIAMKEMTPEDVKGVVSEVNAIVGSFQQHTNHRNNKKDAAHEDKHASHLRRLQITCRKILEDKKICTHCGADAEELLDIKHGKYRKPDGSYMPEFFDIVNKEMSELEKLYHTSTLPDEPDIDKVFDLVMQINELALTR